MIKEVAVRTKKMLSDNKNKEKKIKKKRAVEVATQTDDVHVLCCQVIVPAIRFELMLECLPALCTNKTPGL
jgi:hypothetical protein